MALLARAARLLARPGGARSAPAFSTAAKKAPLVMSVTGPDRKGLLADVFKIISSVEGRVRESHSFNLGPVFSIGLLIDLAEDRHELISSVMETAIPTHNVRPGASVPSRERSG